MRRKLSRPLSPWLAKLRNFLLVALTLSCIPAVLLRWIDPPTSAFMLRSQWLAYREGRDDFRLRYQWVDWPNISRAAALAVVAAEDQTFTAHHGFDLGAISKALRHNRRGKSIRGASTISQQTAKNLFLSPSRNWCRKALETYFTVLLELFLPKHRILEVYLNIAQFGDGVFGVEAASRHYFNKPASRLLPREAALLAATLPNPLLLRADRASAYVIRRRNWILEQMRQLGPDALGEKS